MKGTPPLLVIYNPVCGYGEAQSFFGSTVVPLLQQHGRTPVKIVQTTHVGHAGECVLEYLEAVPEGPLAIVLGSGDGTLHEIIAALATAAPTQAHNSPRDITFVVVPCGTANALYNALFPPSHAQSDELRASKTQSLDVFLSEAATSRPLTLARTTLIPPSDTTHLTTQRSSIAAVVASTALHASILHDSEALRASHPGIERFKLAAQQNIVRWYHANVRLTVEHTVVQNAGIAPVVEVYDPAKKCFVPYEGVGRALDGKSVDLQGPFAYFLSTVNVDRLEPTFRIAPCQSTFPPLPVSTPPTIHVVIVRPLRDPTISSESDGSRTLFAQKSMTIIGGAYRDGSHINMRYGGAGEIVEGEGGDVVVEYFKCNGWEWVPVSVLFTATVDLLKNPTGTRRRARSSGLCGW